MVYISITLDNSRTNSHSSVLPVQGKYPNLLLRVTTNPMKTLDSKMKKKPEKEEKAAKGRMCDSCFYYLLRRNCEHLTVEPALWVRRCPAPRARHRSLECNCSLFALWQYIFWLLRTGRVEVSLASVLFWFFQSPISIHPSIYLPFTVSHQIPSERLLCDCGTHTKHLRRYTDRCFRTDMQGCRSYSSIPFVCVCICLSV